MLLRTACALLLITTLPVYAQTSDPVVNQVIALAKEKAIHASTPDWTVVEKSAESQLLATPGEQGRTSAIRYVLASLRDGHSSYHPPSSDVQGRDAARAPDAMRLPPRIAVVETASSSFARLSINAWIGRGEAMANAATDVRHELAKAVAQNRCGLIVDVSQNSGGNMWPMMGGIAPLYDEGVLETFENRTGNVQRVNVNNGVLRSDDHPLPAIALPLLENTPRHIAVIIGKRTASSGEILALGFKGQRNVRFFGSPTAGATTANTSFPLANGGLLALTTARIRDRTGSVHQGPVVPDVVSEDPVKDAAEWLGMQCQ